MFLTTHWATVNLWLHIVAATVWIGGQITLAALVPVLRSDRTLAAAAARRFQWIAWPAFAVLIVTGVINMKNAGISLTDPSGSPQGRTLMLKLAFVLVSGMAAALHAYLVAPRAGRERTPRTRALSGMLGGVSVLAALIAALYGVTIAEA